MESAVTLEAINVCKSFYDPIKVEILRGINLKVHRGETVAITGRSGEGKSTLIHILGTLDPPCSGTIRIASHDITRIRHTYLRNKHLGFIFQFFHLLEDYTVLENVLMPARIARFPVHSGSEMHIRACTLLEEVELGSRKNFNVKLISGGEKQRTAIARAMLLNPDVILGDELSGNLDSQTSASIHSLLLHFIKRNNKSLVVVTHDSDLAALCDTHYQMHQGQLHQLR